MEARSEARSVDLGGLQGLGVGLIWLGLATLLGFLGAVASAVLLLQGRRLAPALGAGAVGLAAAGGTLTGWLEAWSWDPGDYEVMRIVAVTTASARMLTVFTVGPVAVTFLMGAVVASIRGNPRRPAWAVAALLGTLATCSVTVAGGFTYEDPAFAILRSVAYAVLGSGVAASLLGGDREGGNAPEAGAAAALSFPLIVAAGEGARRGLIDLVLLTQPWPTLDPSIREEAVRQFYAAVSREPAWSQATLATACLVGAIGVAGNLQPGRRVASGIGGALAVVGAIGVLRLGDLGIDRMILVCTAAPVAPEAAEAPAAAPSPAATAIGADPVDG